MKQRSKTIGKLALVVGTVSYSVLAVAVLRNGARLIKTANIYLTEHPGMLNNVGYAIGMILLNIAVLHICNGVGHTEKLSKRARTVVDAITYVALIVTISLQVYIYLTSIAVF